MAGNRLALASDLAFSRDRFEVLLQVHRTTSYFYTDLDWWLLTVNLR